jgi:hypothetical protein
MGNEFDEWEASSRMGERCGIFGCDERPTSQCANCEIWYCFDHFIIHFDITSEKEQDYQKQTHQT